MAQKKLQPQANTISRLEERLGWLGRLTVLALFASYYIAGVFSLKIGPLHVAPWDLVAGGAIIFLTGALAASRLPRPRETNVYIFFAIFLVLAFGIWSSIATIRSPHPEWALTQFIAVLRNTVLFFTLLFLLSFTEAAPLNRALFKFSVIASLFSLLLFALALSKYSFIVNHPEYWDPGYAYTLDYTGGLRLLGLAGDPNFYSLWLVPGFLIGMNALLKRFDRKTFLGTAVIGVSLLLAQSRTFIVALVFSLAVTFLLRFFSQRNYRFKPTRLFSLVVSVGILTALSLFLFKVFADVNVLSILVRRFLTIQSSPRFRYWMELLETLFQSSDLNLVLGHGFRSTLLLTEGRYSHNTFLDLIFETGAIGLAVFSAFLLVVTVSGWIKLKKDLNFLPWFQTWLILLVMFMGFSLAYSPPFLWMIAAILLSTRPSQSSSS